MRPEETDATPPEAWVVEDVVNREMYMRESDMCTCLIIRSPADAQCTEKLERCLACQVWIRVVLCIMADIRDGVFSA